MRNNGNKTRRQLLKMSAALAGAGVVAGCIGNSDDGDDESTGNEKTDTESTATPAPKTETKTPEETPTQTPDDSGDETGSDDSSSSYSVTMEPVGTLEFDSPPETWAANNGSWADMGIALGQDPPEAVYLTGRYHTQLYEEIPDVSVDKSDMKSFWADELDPEEFLSMAEDVDVFVSDPNFIIGRTGDWEQKDIDRITSTGTPFFGNSSFSRGYEWHDYDYLSLYDAFEKMAELFQEQERYAAFEKVHTELQQRIEGILPSEDERPSVAIMWPKPTEKPEKFSPYLIDDGTSFKQWRDLGVEDAFATTDVADFHAGRSRVDYEMLLEIDPDVLLLRGNEAKTAQEFEDTLLSFMQDHNIASNLSAVQNGDVYRGGPLYQGPITNLVMTERAANQVYDVEEELFDRQRVSDIVNGNF
ncbi:ABC transporter substrate-binding protein [Halovenus rubra]|uniref:ABC transporter substrate-binding protein n=2 Tax=Halovenus rubra TaxID=869890 RepID=A0ABD5X5A4_9EURY|nr:ABC transporter substrate-binding protein [Halovenus rubra]